MFHEDDLAVLRSLAPTIERLVFLVVIQKGWSRLG